MAARSAFPRCGAERRLQALELVPVDMDGAALLRQLRERDALFRSLAPGMGLNPQ